MPNSTIVEIKQAAQNCLDGMSYSRNKLAKDAIYLCDTVERLTVALREEQAKNSKTQSPSTENPFGDLFKDLF